MINIFLGLKGENKAKCVSVRVDPEHTETKVHVTQVAAAVL